MSDKEYSRWGEIRALQESHLRLWPVYMNWFTWFFGINLVALGWILSYGTGLGEGISVFAAIMIYCDLQGVLAARAMARQQYSLVKRARDLRSEDDNGPDVEVMLANPLARRIAWLTGLVMFITIPIWAYVAFEFGMAHEWFSLALTNLEHHLYGGH